MMRIEANLPGGIDGWAFHAAGLYVEGWSDLNSDHREGRPRFPKALKSTYLPDPSIAVSVTALSIGDCDNIDRWIGKSGRMEFKRVAKADEPTRVRIEIDDDKAGRAIRKTLEFYS